MTSAKNFLSAEEQKKVLAAISEAELNTSGEIRVHLENFCIGNEVKAAQKVFQTLNMQNTRERNGVLLYVATYSRKIAIIGDKGIHERLGAAFWDKMVADMIAEFKNNHKAEALVTCILECGKGLKKFFPLQDDDTNELTNEISY